MAPPVSVSVYTPGSATDLNVSAVGLIGVAGGWANSATITALALATQIRTPVACLVRTTSIGCTWMLGTNDAILVPAALADIGYPYWDESDNPAYKLFLG